MSECPIVSAVLAVIQSVRDLQNRVAILIPSVSLPANLSTLFGDGQGLINEIYISVQQFILAAGSDITVAAERPIEPAAQVCHTGPYVLAVKAWIDSIQIAAQSICDLNLDSEGGDEGYDQSFNAANGGYTIELTYDTFYQKDRIILYNQDDAVLYDSGCVGTGGDVVVEVTIPAGTDSIRVVVEPNCEGGTGTLWNLSVRCI